MMKDFNPKQSVQQPTGQNNRSSSKPDLPELQTVRKTIYWRAFLVLLTIVLTIVILFAMTSAWYTNVVQTSGLTFQAEAWSFDGTITVDETPIQAAPGDDGIVHLIMENSSDAVSSVSVNVSKTGMDAEMQKRLFFYVDTQMNRGEETMERVYLNKFEGYTYSLFSQGNLTLTEQVHNGPVIKWEWVYDVLGYYVVGQPREVVTDGNTTKDMVIREYLRPIEYDFDAATTAISTEGESVVINLSTVDGETTPEQFLVNLSKKDGYPGQINPAAKLDFGNYYPVEVDENGYGVYAYLCSYTDIEMETRYDTWLGELAYQNEKGEELSETQRKALSHTATLVLSAQKEEHAPVNVTTLGGLQDAITQGTANVVALSSDITIPADAPLTIPEGTQMMVDLNGNTITSMSPKAIEAAPGSSLTLTNGLLANGSGDLRDTTGVRATGAELIMSGVQIQGFAYGIYIADNAGDNEQDSMVHLLGCTIEGADFAVVASGNGLLSQQKSQLIIEDSTLRSTGVVISGNGTFTGNGRWGTDIQIINSAIEAQEINGVYGTGIYHPQKDSTLTVYGSTVSGCNGISIKGGSVSIVDSVIEGLGEYQKPNFGNSGCTDTGDAVYIETNYGVPISLTISGSSELRSTKQQTRSLRVYEEDAAHVQVRIESGIFGEEQLPQYLAETSVQTYDESTQKAYITVAQ